MQRLLGTVGTVRIVVYNIPPDIEGVVTLTGVRFAVK